MAIARRYWTAALTLVQVHTRLGPLRKWVVAVSLDCGWELRAPWGFFPGPQHPEHKTHRKGSKTPGWILRVQTGHQQILTQPGARFKLFYRKTYWGPATWD